MRLLLNLLVAGAAISQSSVTLCQEGATLIIGATPSDSSIDNDSFYVCDSWSPDGTRKYISTVVSSTPGKRAEISKSWNRKMQRDYGLSFEVTCWARKTLHEAGDLATSLAQSATRQGRRVVRVSFGPGGEAAKQSFARDDADFSQVTTKSKDNPGAGPVSATPSSRENDRAAAAEEQQALAKINADEATRQQRITDHITASKRKQAEQRQQYLQQVAASTAAKIEWEKTVEAVRAQHAAYEAKMSDYNRQLGCRAGDKTNCGPSTDTDANRCVTAPELRVNATFQGNTAAVVTNGCPTAVDVRICLMREPGEWNCGVGSRIAPHSSFSHSSFKATGRVFSDARIADSPRALAQPQ